MIFRHFSTFQDHFMWLGQIYKGGCNRNKDTFNLQLWVWRYFWWKKLDKRERTRSNGSNYCCFCIILIINCLQLHGLQWASKAAVPSHSYIRDKNHNKTKQNGTEQKKGGRGVMSCCLLCHFMCAIFCPFVLVSMSVKWSTERQNYKES